MLPLPSHPASMTGTRCVRGISSLLFSILFPSRRISFCLATPPRTSPACQWDNFYEKIPISLLHHTNGNAIYNTSHPLLERLVGQLEIEAPCPYNSIPYDYRMSQMWVEGTLGIVPTLATKIMLNEEGQNITLSNVCLNRRVVSSVNLYIPTHLIRFCCTLEYRHVQEVGRDLGARGAFQGEACAAPTDDVLVSTLLGDIRSLRFFPPARRRPSSRRSFTTTRPRT